MDAIRNRRAIVDRKALIAAFEGLVEDADPHAPEVRAGALGIIKDALGRGREEVRRRLHGGADGRAIAQATAFLVDQIVRVLYDFAAGRVFPATNPTAGERLSLVAVGGYGRAEMAPYSDVDILFLLPYKQTPWGEQVVEYLLYMLWDAGLKVGHATRSVDECMRLARADITIRTAVLEARYVWGDEALYEELRTRFQREVVADSGPAFVEAKLAERDARHVRMGDSRYLLEPNVKDGKGGLRDLHTLFWIAKYLYRVAGVAELVEQGVLTAAERRRFAKAEAFLWTVRCHLHDLAGRAEERLTFDVQAEIGHRLGYGGRAGSRSVERFMKHYFLIAKDVGDLTRIFCAALEEQHKRRRRFRWPSLALRRREIDGFRVEGERLALADKKDFADDPVAMVRLFHVAERHRLDIHPRTLRAITRSLKLVDASYRGDGEANRLFLEILTGREDPETALRRMNEAGLLGRFLPDFGRVVAQMQHDMYHVYTVDEHTIRAIGVLSRIERGALAEDHPLSNEIIHKVISRRVLYVAVLLHDIAKGRGGGHSELGAGVAERLGPRLGLDAAETETAAWLVRHHLLMSATAFKRDIADPKTVEDFVAVVQSLERLRLLVVLTVADIRAVGPGRWNGWKGQLLRDLYYRAEEVMSGGHVAEARASRVAAAKAALGERLADWEGDEIDRHLARGYDSYWLSLDGDTHAYHARLMRRADRDDAPLTVDTRIDRFKAVTEVTVYTADHSGLFASVAGAIAVSGATIVDAKIFTTSDGMAIDSFRIQDTEGGPFERPEKLARLAVAVEQTLAGRLRPHQVLARKAGLPSRTEVFTVQPQVFIDNAASNTQTVIEVNGRDRRGFLHDVTRTLTDLGLSISSAHVNTFGERAVDVFYVRDVFGLQVTREAKLETIRERLLAAVGAPEAEPDAALTEEPKPAKGKRGPAKRRRAKKGSRKAKTEASPAAE